VCRYGKLGSPPGVYRSPSNNIAQKALTVKFISYRKSVKFHSQMKDVNKKEVAEELPYRYRRGGRESL
jgi:hypothetical protein